MIVMELLKIDSVVECRIVSRINRFVVEIFVNGERRMANINNTGRLHELLIKGRRGYCIRGGIKTDYKLFGIKTGRCAAIIDTRLQMKSFEIAVSKNLIPWLKGCRILKRNVKVNESTIDYLLKCDYELYLEVKSAALRKSIRNTKYAMYPDCPSLRGRRHVLDLIEYVKQGKKAAILFIASVPKVRAFKPNRQGDYVLSKLIRKAANAGVVVKAISMHYNPENSTVILDNPQLKVRL